MTAVARIHFVLSARDLPNKVRGSTGLSSIPDPYARVWHKDNVKTDWKELAKSDHVVNSSNPNWLEVFNYDWKRGTNQVWRIEILDFDPLNKDDLIAAVEVDVDNYVLQENRNASRTLANGATLNIIEATELHFKIQVENLPKLDVGSASDPYVECFWSFGLHGEKHKFHRTKTVDDAQNVAFRKICFHNYQKGANQYLTFRVYDEDTVADETIGEVTFALDAYVTKGTSTVYRLNEAKNNAIITVTPA